MPEPDLDRLDRIVDGDLADGGRLLSRSRPGDGAEHARSQPDWSRTLVGLLERLLERLDRLEADVEDVGKRVDTAADGLTEHLVRGLAPAQRAEDALAVLNGQVAGLDAQVRELRAAFEHAFGDPPG